MLNKLTILADELDKLGLIKEADFIDDFIQKLATEEDEWAEEPTKVDPIAQGLQPLPPLGQLREEQKEKEPQPFLISKLPQETPQSLFLNFRLAINKILNYKTWDHETKELISKLTHKLKTSL